MEEIDQTDKLLKVHLPYHESDHVLNLAYNVLVGEERLEDIELRRQDESFLNGLGAQRIPDPTTAGDFTRRFSIEQITELQECINRTRQRVWRKQPEGFLAEGFIDVDGMMAGTYGQCKGGMALLYQGIWGYAPLVVNWPTPKRCCMGQPVGQCGSHQDSVSCITGRALAPVAGRITLRGDTDFTHTAQLDGWDEAGPDFILGMEGHPKVVALAECLAEQSWRPLKRLPQYEILTEPRSRRERVRNRSRCKRDI